MGFEDVAIKETCEIYTLKIPEEYRWRCAWAKIIIDSKNWMFSCLSDAGNFSYRWATESGRVFKKFLTGIDMCYLMRKIEPRATDFDYDKTVKALKEAIFEQRREGNIDKKEAREVYAVVENLDYENSPDLIMHQLIEGTKFFSDDYCWTADHMVYNHTPGAITFTEVVFPLFQKALKFESMAKSATIDGDAY